MPVLRTPGDRFVALPDFPFDPHYVDAETRGIDPLRMHYVDAGPPDAPVVVLLHGQPTWSYSYRHVIAVLVDAGLRVIAPDHIGYGRSDKLTDPTDYTFKRHIDWLHSAIRRLDLQHITLVVQDWGGPIGLSALARDPGRYAGVVATNTILHTCDPALAGRLEWPHHATGDGQVVHQETLLDYVAFYQRAPELVPSLFLDAVAGPLSPDVLAAYDAPFPDRRFTAGLRQMIALIPLTRNDVGAAIGRSTMAALADFRRPFLTAYSDGDPATRGWDRVFADHVPGAEGQPHTTVTGAGHFIQEQRGAELGRIVAEFVARNG
ncbi:alpha/beta fold hydrolase [Mycolicibacterium flavescens]|uniref:Alpha/beta hydrolase n=1 Tax=Mycolicibacterium flavescens TaxID=1776 RepID=A0A1E3RL51_MYCFV|nr:haloalkane dehalogenase [Mycolicibacterium flavescens]MCV7278959.1 alpha/beta fold hydrolase [Mycolicibacterium flavescens]ODQ90578.1 alpha/beta hydrolase [Mycolicibacterium flavescens]